MNDCPRQNPAYRPTPTYSNPGKKGFILTHCYFCRDFANATSNTNYHLSLFCNSLARSLSDTLGGNSMRVQIYALSTIFFQYQRVFNITYLNDQLG
jgi:hypothetical protein